MSVRNLFLMHPRNQIILIIDKIYKNGLTTTSGGNLSIMDENGDMWVTPSGVDKGALKPDDIMCIKADGAVIGKHKPSMEYPFHKAIYKERPDIKSVVHAHPAGLVAFSIIRQIPNSNISPQVNSKCGKVGYAKYFIPGSDALGSSISGQFSEGYDSVIMENHGAVVGGKDIFQAYERFETLEYTCRIIKNANIVGKPEFLTSNQIEKANQVYDNESTTIPSTVYSTEEKAIRQEICEFMYRACNQNLMMSAYGTISVRLKNDNFLITPGDIIRWDIKPNDIIRVDCNPIEKDNKTSCSFALHQEIYKKHPDINAIIMTQPEHLMAYSISHKKLDVRTIPESWIFLQDMDTVKFGSQFSPDSLIPEKISIKNPGVIIENDSVLMTGHSLLQAFDRLEVAEFSAASLIMGTSLGEFSPMSDKEINELKEKFC